MSLKRPYSPIAVVSFRQAEQVWVGPAWPSASRATAKKKNGAGEVVGKSVAGLVAAVAAAVEGVVAVMPVETTDAIVVVAAVRAGIVGAAMVVGDDRPAIGQGIPFEVNALLGKAWKMVAKRASWNGVRTVVASSFVRFHYPLRGAFRLAPR